MPPARRRPAVGGQRRSYGCRVHCQIWWGGDGTLVLGCAHCPVVTKRIDVSLTYDNDTLVRQIKRSREGHELGCGRPIYSA